MKKTTKKTLGEMIGEMLQAEELNADQMQIIDILCQINESDEITSNTAYYVNNNRVDEFEDFVVENAEEIWAAFNACKTLDKNIKIIYYINVERGAYEKQYIWICIFSIHNSNNGICNI